MKKLCVSWIYPRHQIVSNKTLHIYRLNFKKTFIVFIMMESCIFKSVFLYTVSLGTCLVKVKFFFKNTAVLPVCMEGFEIVRVHYMLQIKEVCLLYVSFPWWKYFARK